ncbi:MAG: hypothetical protein ABEK16_01365 [Candidatus Nanohalobium sp.]
MTSDSLSLGQFKGKSYEVVYRPDYKLEDVENSDDFCITLVCRNPETEENEEVVTLDTAHGFVHIDLKFQEHPFKDDKVPLEHLDYWSAYRKIVDNWEEFARKHERNR